MMLVRDEPNPNQQQIKRVSVRSGGAGYAHSGIIRSEVQSAKQLKSPDVKIVRLGR